MKVTAVIPARYDASRLPGKVLKDIGGKTMIQRVYEQTEQADNLDRVIVATDDERVYEEVKSFGGRVEMTSQEHTTGTDRIAEVAQDLRADIIVNVQGDEPLLNPAMIDQAVKPLLADEEVPMSTLKHKIDDKSELEDHNAVKVVTDQDDFALYFSRSLIPYPRSETEHTFYKHIGLYVYRRDFLLDYTNLAPTRLEEKESLEQLRALENGYKIKVVETDYQVIGVDTEEDLQKVRKKLKAIEN